MSKVFSFVTLSTPTGSFTEEFITPGIPQPDCLGASIGDGISVEDPGEYGRDPDDFFYDKDDFREIIVEYTAYSFGVGQSEDPSGKELQALALIFGDPGSALYDVLYPIFDVVQTGHFTAHNPFWEDEDDEDDDE